MKIIGFTGPIVAEKPEQPYFANQRLSIFLISDQVVLMDGRKSRKPNYPRRNKNMGIGMRKERMELVIGRGKRRT